MKKIFFNLVSYCLLMVCVSSFGAESFMFEQNLKNFVQSGVQHYKTVGLVQAYKDFSDPTGGFVIGDNYLFVLDYAGNFLAHGGGDATVMKKNYLDYTDKLGVAVTKLLISAAKQGGGFVGYYWPSPKSGRQEFKVSYVAPLNKNTLIGSGQFFLT